MKARTIIMIVAVISSMVLLGGQADTKAAVAAQAGPEMPVGSIVAYAGSTPPEGWLLCDGALYDVSVHAALFDVVEFTYGSNASKSAFRVPDLGGKVVVGQKPFTYYCDTLGKAGGEAEVSLSESEMPSHTHNVSASSHSHSMSVSPHNHTITVSPHDHSVNVSSHSHSITDPRHNHGVNDPKHSHSVNDPGHSHLIDLDDSLGSHGVDDAGESSEGTTSTGTSTTGITLYTASTGIGINTASTGISVGSATVSVDVLSATPSASSADTTVGASAGSATVSISEQSKGGNSSHQNLQPYIVLNYIIKY